MRLIDRKLLSRVEHNFRSICIQSNTSVEVKVQRVGRSTECSKKKKPKNF